MLKTFNVKMKVVYPACVVETYTVTAESVEEAENKVMDGVVDSTALISYTAPEVFTSEVIHEEVISVEETEEVYEHYN